MVCSDSLTQKTTEFLVEGNIYNLHVRQMPLKDLPKLFLEIVKNEFSANLLYTFGELSVMKQIKIKQWNK